MYRQLIMAVIAVCLCVDGFSLPGDARCWQARVGFRLAGFE